LIESLRNSDADAGLYWLARLIEGVADPVFIARRLCILASEDVGLADPQAMVQASAAAEITRLIGLPEALYPLAQATIYLARPSRTWSSGPITPRPPMPRPRLANRSPST
jgi:putative ATPase